MDSGRVYLDKSHCSTGISFDFFLWNNITKKKKKYSLKKNIHAYLLNFIQKKLGWCIFPIYSSFVLCVHLLKMVCHIPVIGHYGPIY